MNAPLDESHCCEMVSDGERWANFYQCKRKWTVERDGKRYCNQHDPKAVDERREKAAEKWREENRIRAEKRQLEAAAPDLLAACHEAVRIIDACSPDSPEDIAGLEMINAAIDKAEGSSQT